VIVRKIANYLDLQFDDYPLMNLTVVIGSRQGCDKSCSCVIRNVRVSNKCILSRLDY
jgi:hypothetical protein